MKEVPGAARSADVPEPAREAPALAPVLCAWCERERRRTVLGHKASGSSSHGICDPHRRAVMEDL